jgi:pyruvate dehydrogenase E1 component beta subunit
MVEAIAMAHGWEMQHDANVVVIGQDVGANGGVFRATAGLQSFESNGNISGRTSP